jgi:hypothetical protein
MNQNTVCFAVLRNIVLKIRTKYDSNAHLHTFTGRYISVEKSYSTINVSLDHKPRGAYSFDLAKPQSCKRCTKETRNTPKP